MPKQAWRRERQGSTTDRSCLCSRSAHQVRHGVGRADMSIFAARLVAGAGASRVEGRVRFRGVYSTHPPSCGVCYCSVASTSSRIGSQSGLALSRSSHIPTARRSSGLNLEDERLKIGKVCPRGCGSGGVLFQLRHGRADQSAAAAGRIVDECPLRRYAIVSTDHHSASCVLALGTMRSGGDGWKRVGAGRGLEQQRRKYSCTGWALADNGSKSEASQLTNGNSNQNVSPPLPGTKLLTIPTILTLARVAAVPAILAVFYCKETWATAAGVAIFILAAVTDWLDGYLARKMGSSSAFGAFLDPVADKLMVAAVLVLLCTRPLPISGFATTPWLLPLPTIAIIGREITMSAVREWAAAQGAEVLKAVAVNNLGKIKTASQMIAITLLLATGDGGLDSMIAGYLGIALLYVAAGLALWSLALYMKGIWGSLSK